MEKSEIKQIVTDFAEHLNQIFPFGITDEDIAGYMKKYRKQKAISYQKWFQKENQL